MICLKYSGQRLSTIGHSVGEANGQRREIIQRAVSDVVEISVSARQEEAVLVRVGTELRVSTLLNGVPLRLCSHRCIPILGRLPVSQRFKQHNCYVPGILNAARSNVAPEQTILRFLKMRLWRQGTC